MVIKSFVTWLYWKIVFKPMVEETKLEIEGEVIVDPDDPYWIQLQRERQFNDLH